MLEEQLPPHDSDPKYCRSLNEDEKNELRIFNEQQRHTALGRGSARQLPLTQSPMPCRGVSLILYHSLKHVQVTKQEQIHRILLTVYHISKFDIEKVK
jgi:hypothetical protein